MAHRLFWPCWLVTTLLVGIVAGFMLGHALILARFLDWMLVAGPSGLLAQTYPVFRASHGQGGLAAFYTVAGLEVLAALSFGAVAIAGRQHRTVGVFVAVAGTAWLVVHYASGFGALERAVLQATGAVSPPATTGFVTWNQRVHAFHAGSLIVTLIVLLTLPLRALRRRG